MATKRATRLIALTACASAAFTATVPAAAQAPAQLPSEAAPATSESKSKASVELRRLHERRAEPRRQVHPLTIAPDYGTPENAFGAARSGHVHEGQDVFAPAGSPLVAVTDGVIAEAGTDGAQGNYVYLYDPRAERTYVYMHMVGPAPVKTGQRVHAGDRLGGVGCTGSCWGEHLHFEVHDGRGMAGPARDPLPLLREWERASG